MRSLPVAAGQLRLWAILSNPLVWFIACPSAIAWDIMVFMARNDPASSLCLAPRPTASALMLDSMALALVNLSAASLAQSCVLMAAAMALPLAWRPADHVLTRSFSRYGAVHVAIFAAVIIGTWSGFLVFLSILGIVLQAGLASAFPLPLLGCAATLLVALHRRTDSAETAIRRCHRMHPIRAFAPGSVHDVMRFGAGSALACARACWPGMLLPWLTTQPLLAMILVTALSFRDRAIFRPDRREAIIALGVLAASELISAV